MIDYQSAPIIFILQIAIRSIIADVIAAQPLILYCRADLFGYVLCVHIVDQVFKSSGELFTGVGRAAVIIVADGNKAYAEERKDAFQIFSGLYIVSAKAGKVLHNDAIDSPFPHILDHSIKCGTLKIGARVAVIGIYLFQFEIGPLGKIVSQQQFLIFNRICIDLAVVLNRQTNIKCGTKHGLPLTFRLTFGNAVFP